MRDTEIPKLAIHWVDFNKKPRLETRHLVGVPEEDIKSAYFMVGFAEGLLESMRIPEVVIQPYSTVPGIVYQDLSYMHDLLEDASERVVEGYAGNQVSGFGYHFDPVAITLTIKRLPE